jgi:hypothetical protein
MSAGGGGGVVGPPPASRRLAAFDLVALLDDMPVFVRDGQTRPKTHGRWVDEDGVVHDLLSGEHDGVYKAVNQRAIDLGIIPAGTGLARAGDVELKFALGMRRTWERTKVAPKEKIVINHPDGPCEGEYSCDGLLSRYLPPGGELTVYWLGGNSRTYRGESS